MVLPYEGRRLDVADLPEVLRTLEFSSFRPQGVVLHHTAVPSLKQRPQGLLPNHLVNLRLYYEKELGWSGAPHLFVDDQPRPVVIFQRLDRRGVHAASYNRTHWAVEMLGDYSKESPGSGRGKEVYRNTLQVLGALFEFLNRSPDELLFHRDDPLTNKTCPGLLIHKEKVIRQLRQIMGLPDPFDLGIWRIRLPNGKFFEPVRHVDGRPAVPVRRFLSELGVETKPVYLADLSRVRLGSKEVPISQLSEDGTAWIWVRTLADSLGYQLTLRRKVITLLEDSEATKGRPYR